jgi:small ligand-binding sensory domain FIST
METTTETFRLAHAADAPAEALVERCLAALGPVRAGANIGFVYATDALHGQFDAIVEKLRRATGIDSWIGTVGYGICVTGKEYFDEPALAVLVGALDADAFRLLPTVARPGDALPKDVTEWARRAKPRLGVVHGDPRNAYLPQILDSVADDVDCFLVGGVTASRASLRQVAGEVTEGGLSGVLFAESVGTVSGLTQGCSPIGPTHRITEGRDNVLMELDGRPALDVFKEDAGELIARNLARAAGYLHAALPIPGSDKADYLVRNLVGIDPAKGWLAIGARIERGDRVMFVRRDAASAMADLDRMVGDVAKRAAAPPRAALYFSCVARGPNLFGPNSEELRCVGAALGEVPLIGFYANGEISNNRLYGYTGVLTLLG